MQAVEDMALLREYAANRSDEAFAELVSRYVNFVHSAALRQAGDPNLAEEVTQAVFIILAQKAGKISDKTVLAGWLFNTARFAALAQMRAEAKRRQREQEAYMQNELQSSNSTAEEYWRQISPCLDEALAALGEKDRQAVLLRFFENKSLAEVGATLNAGEDTARKRVSRALEKLRKFFAKRRIISTTAIIAGVISANSVQAAPAGLATTITATAVKGSAVAGSTLALVKGTLKLMTYTKLKLAVGVAIIVLLGAGMATVAISQTSGDDKLTAQEIARESQKAYAALSSYSDTGKASSQGGGADTETTFNIHLQRANLYRIEWTQTGGFYTSKGAIWSDGMKNYFVMGTANQMDAEKPEKIHDMETAIGMATGVSSSTASDIPGTFFNLHWGDQLGIFTKGRAQSRREADEKVGGADCFVVSGSLGPAKLPNGGGSSGTMTTRLWIGKRDHLIRQIQTTMEGASINLKITDESLKTVLQRQGKQPTPEAMAALRAEMEQGQKEAQGAKFVFTQTHENISVNQKFSPSDFNQSF